MHDAIQLSMFTDEVVKSRKPVKTSGYVFPWYWEMARDWNADGKKMIDKYSPWQMKLWAWLKKNATLGGKVKFDRDFLITHLGGKYKGKSISLAGNYITSCPQVLISRVLHRAYTQTWWNYRHRSRGRVKWNSLDVMTKIYFRENYHFNFAYSAKHTQPEDPHFLFECWYGREYDCYPSKRMRQMIHKRKNKAA